MAVGNAVASCMPTKVPSPRFFSRIRKSRGKRPRHLEAFLAENQVPFYHGQLGNASAYESIRALAELAIWDIGQFL